MAKSKQRRRRKHRGSQSGRVDPARRAARPRTREQAKAQMRARNQSVRDRPPTWSGAAKRAALAAAVFFLVIALLFKQPIGAAVSLSGLMLLLYVPMGFYFDSMLYRRRQREQQRAKERAGS